MTHLASNDSPILVSCKRRVHAFVMMIEI